MGHKPKILLCWGYNRHAWVETFEKIKDDFEFVYLFFYTKPVEDIKLVTSEVRYWSEFSSPAKLLAEIKPEKVVMMSNTHMNTIALNLECRKQRIPTMVLQHGLFQDINYYIQQWRQQQELEKKMNFKIEESKFIDNYGRLALFSFYLKALSLRQFIPGIQFLVKFQYYKRRLSFWEAVQKCRSHFFWADYYIVYTKHNARIYHDQEGVNENRMIEIGSPQADDFFKQVREVREDDYFLLIDEPHSETPFFETLGIVTNEQMNDFYQKLNNYALMHGKKLRIKLHPDSYASTFFIQHPNIEYIKHTESLVDLIVNSSIVFGYTSTLLIPTLYFKKCCLFRLIPSEFQKQLEAIGICPVLDFFNFNLENLDPVNFIPSEAAKDKYVKLFLYRTDGKAVERIRQILLTHPETYLQGIETTEANINMPATQKMPSVIE